MYKYFFKVNLNLMKLKNKFYYSTRKNKENNNPIQIEKLTNIRHFPTAIREWNNSIYNFNKNNSNYSVTKYNQLDLLFKNYFNLSNNVRIARSKRMRYLRRKSTSKKIYSSKPEVKQNNDKITITVYYYDRTKQLLLKKLFFYNRPKLSRKIIDLAKNKFLAMRLKVKQKKRFLIPSSGIRYLKELKDFNSKNLLRNKRIEQSMRFQFIRYILSIFGIQIFIPILSPLFFDKKTKLSYLSNRKIKKANQERLINIINLNPKILYWINHNLGEIEEIKGQHINYNFLIRKLADQRKGLKKNIVNLKSTDILRLQIINKLLAIINRLITYNNITDVTLMKLFNNLSNKLNNISKQSLHRARARKIPRVLNFFQHNLLKFKKLLPALKKLIDNLYNKKVQLNLVNLKYFYLNSDIITQVLVPKIQKRINAINVLRKSLRTIKPTVLPSNERKVNAFNNLNFLSLNSNLSLNSLSRNNLLTNSIKQDKDNMLNDIFNTLFPNNYIYNNNTNSKINNTLSSIKYKSLLGVWIEARGRLTRRNTASRSVTHIIHKGDLKDKNKYIYLNKENIIPTVILRNSEKSNTQYSYKGSYRHIGSFGIRTWISSR